jgi:hypothetical protein
MNFTIRLINKENINQKILGILNRTKIHGSIGKQGSQKGSIIYNNTKLKLFVGEDW